MNTLSTYCNSILKELETELLLIHSERECPITRSEKAIPLCRQYLQKLRNYVLQHPFNRRSEEVFFFKHVQPIVVAKLIYYAEVFNAEQEMMGMSAMDSMMVLFRLDNKMDNFFNQYGEFCDYYERDATHMDFKIYISSPKNPFYQLITYPIELDPVQFYGNPVFSTSHDYKTAQIIAYKKLRQYVEEGRDELTATRRQPEKKIKFNGSPDEFVDWVGFMKAMIESNDKENGKELSAEQLADVLQHVFDVDLGKFDDYKTLEICSNGSDLPERLVSILEGYIRVIEEEDEDVEYGNEENIEDDTDAL